MSCENKFSHFLPRPEWDHICFDHVHKYMFAYNTAGLGCFGTIWVGGFCACKFREMGRGLVRYVQKIYVHTYIKYHGLEFLLFNSGWLFYCIKISYIFVQIHHT